MTTRLDRQNDWPQLRTTSRPATLNVGGRGKKVGLHFGGHPSGQSDKMSRAYADSEIHKSCASVFTYLIYFLEMCLNFHSRTYIPFGKTCDETDTYMVPLRMPCDVTGWCGGPKPCDSDVVYFETKEHLSVYRWSWIGGVCMFFSFPEIASSFTLQ